jgi:hypothetical protein
MNKNQIYKFMFILVILSSLTLLTGCARTEYVCYDGSVQKTIAKCPIIQVTALTSQDAETIADNYGRAVASAKRDSYTKVNVYMKNSTWYANILFTNSDSGNIANVLLKIHGQTGDVSCVTGCDYLAVPAVVNTTEPVNEVVS